VALTPRPAGIARRAALVLVAAASLAPAAGAADFPGTARQVVPTQGEIGYRSLTGSAPAARPTVDKRRGFENGWQASYLKGAASAPVQAIVLVYVYKTPADARLAWTRSCKGCREQTAAGVRMKVKLGKSNGATGAVVTGVATCRNLYAAIVAGGKATPDKLGADAGAIAGSIFRRAVALGMTPCSSS